MLWLLLFGLALAACEGAPPLPPESTGPAQPMSARAAGPRRMERLGRGVVAVRRGNQVLVSWRLLGLDPPDLGFNLYRRRGSGAATRLGGGVLRAGTNFVDTTADLSQDNTYFVRPVGASGEQAASAPFTLTANHASEPIVRVPIGAPPPGYSTKFIWVGDLDGDGEYDFVVDRLAPWDPNQVDTGAGNQKLEAYRRNGERLWEIDLGPGSRGIDNIHPGAGTISVGHYDGVTVYDLDGDGKAEVILKFASGVTFGNGASFQNANPERQFLGVVDGMTGALRAWKSLPTDYSQYGPLGLRLGIGYLDGRTPSIVGYMKNRRPDKAFNLIIAAWTWHGGNLGESWMWKREGQDAPDGHQTRIVDVDGDGRDEICEIGFCLNGDGTLRYSLGPSGIIHGDRFHIGKFDPARPGLQGYGIQQNNPSGLLEYYYDAADGKVLWRHFGAVADVGRGSAGDISPEGPPGFEVWSFQGVYTASTNARLAEEPNRPWPNFRLFWDGDVLSENLDETKIDKWDPATGQTQRLVSCYHYGATPAGHNPAFYGDILGDWREEVVYTNAAFSELLIFTTDQPSDQRIYTLAHDPAYRNAMTLKGYMQSHQLDYYLGHGMAPPPVPAITY